MTTSVTAGTVARMAAALDLLETGSLPVGVRLGTDAYVTHDGEEIPLQDWEQQPERITVTIHWTAV